MVVPESIVAKLPSVVGRQFYSYIMYIYFYILKFFYFYTFSLNFA